MRTHRGSIKQHYVYRYLGVPVYHTSTSSATCTIFQLTGKLYPTSNAASCTLFQTQQIVLTVSDVHHCKRSSDCTMFGKQCALSSTKPISLTFLVHCQDDSHGPCNVLTASCVYCAVGRVCIHPSVRLLKGMLAVCRQDWHCVRVLTGSFAGWDIVWRGSWCIAFWLLQWHCAGV